MDIVLADDHGLVRDGLRPFLQEIAEGARVLDAATFEQAVAAASGAPRLSLILLDLMMPGMNDLDGVRDMVGRFPTVPVVVLSGRFDRALILGALDCGAKGYVPKTTSGQALLNALRLVLSGEVYVPSAVFSADDGGGGALAARGGGEANGVLAKLTEREQEILRLLIAGGSNKMIARSLDLQEITIKVHLSNVYRKIGVSNRAQAVRVAMEAGLSPQE